MPAVISTAAALVATTAVQNTAPHLPPLAVAAVLVFVGILLITSIISIFAARENGMGFWSTVWAVLIALGLFDFITTVRPLVLAAIRQAGGL